VDLRSKMMKMRRHSSRAADGAQLGFDIITRNNSHTMNRSRDSASSSKNAFARGASSHRPRKKDRKQTAKSTGHNKPPAKRVFNVVAYRQRFHAHNGPIWTMKFSKDGSYLATGSLDSVLKIWRVSASSTDYDRISYDASDLMDDSRNFIEDVPYRSFEGHSKDIVDMDWSSENFILSASMDCTVRLWHISKSECLRVFKHGDIVSAVEFHPLDNTIFLSGAFCGKMYLWSVVENAPLSIVNVEDYITTAAMAPDARFVMVGTVHGHVKWYTMRNEVSREWRLKSITQIDIRPERSTHESERNGKSRKVTGIVTSPSGKEFLITTNDSHVRLHMSNDKSLRRLFRGQANENSNLRGTFSDDEKFIICPSDAKTLSIWEKEEQPSNVAKSKNKVDIVTAYESITVEDEKNHSKERLTGALFAPRIEDCDALNRSTLQDKEYIIVVSTYLGNLTILQSKGAADVS